MQIHRIQSFVELCALSNMGPEAIGFFHLVVEDLFHFRSRYPQIKELLEHMSEGMEILWRQDIEPCSCTLSGYEKTGFMLSLTQELSKNHPAEILQMCRIIIRAIWWVNDPLLNDLKGNMEQCINMVYILADDEDGVWV